MPPNNNFQREIIEPRPRGVNPAPLPASPFASPPPPAPRPPAANATANWLSGQLQAAQQQAAPLPTSVDPRYLEAQRAMLQDLQRRAQGDYQSAAQMELQRQAQNAANQQFALASSTAGLGMGALRNAATAAGDIQGSAVANRELLFQQEKQAGQQLYQQALGQAQAQDVGQAVNQAEAQRAQQALRDQYLAYLLGMGTSNDIAGFNRDFGLASQRAQNAIDMRGQGYDASAAGVGGFLRGIPILGPLVAGGVEMAIKDRKLKEGY